MNIEEIGKHIRQYRKLKGLTQESLAEKANLSVMSVRRYESGERIAPENVLKRIANVLEIPVDILKGLSEGETLKKWFEDGNKYSAIPYEIHQKYSIPIDTANQIVEYVTWAYRDEFRSSKDVKLDDQESRLVNTYRVLNDKGQKVVIERVEELAEHPRYQKRQTENPEITQNPPEGKK